ncbi:hypothetical protein ACH5RR_020416 [Cinchona calisaya]|uniref:Transposase n=1 Tax=Cinchona calisaya TaxID=153742 RepID=A0ABD2ZED6_9GENT
MPSSNAFKCLKEWGIENKIFTISVDNASNNDVAIRLLKDTFSMSKNLVCAGKLFHVRCCTHILNLMVQDGLSQIVDISDNIRESVEFVNRSDGRLLLFADIVQQLRLPGRKLIYDCRTRWNSTFEMLSCAIKFKEVFPRFRDREPHYDCCPSEEDWAVEFCFPQLFPSNEAQENISKVRTVLFELYDEYVAANDHDQLRKRKISQVGDSSMDAIISSSTSGWNDFDDFLRQSETLEPQKSELVNYLEKGPQKNGPDANPSVKTSKEISLLIS